MGRARHGQGCPWLPLSPCLWPSCGHPCTGTLSPTGGPWGAQPSPSVSRKGRGVCASGTSLFPWVQGARAGPAPAWLRAWGVQRCPGSHSPRPASSPFLPFLPEFLALRLQNSDGCSGRLQVFYNGTWGSICSNLMTLDTVSLACKELGCGDGGSLETRLPYGRVSGPAWLDNVQCGKKTSSFWQCPSTPWDPQSCEDLREEIHITCNGNSEPLGHSVTPAPAPLYAQPNTEGLFLSVSDPSAAGGTNVTTATQVQQQLSPRLPAAPGGGRGISRGGLRRDHTGFRRDSPPQTRYCCSVNQGPLGAEQSGSPQSCTCPLNDRASDAAMTEMVQGGTRRAQPHSLLHNPTQQPLHFSVSFFRGTPRNIPGAIGPMPQLHELHRY